jgi:hypothetical protein
MEKFSMRLPLSGDFFTTVRLTTGGLCSLVGFDVDGAEDYKVCVTECLLILKRNGFSHAEIDFTVGEMLSCEARGVGETGEKETGLDDEISYALLNALLGEIRVEKNADGTVIALAFEG